MVVHSFILFKLFCVLVTLLFSFYKLRNLLKTIISIEPMVKDSQKQKDEIVWALKLVLSGYFNNSCADISKMFTCILPDSKIAKSFGRGATKLQYVINFVIALYFRDILYNHLQKSDCFVISFDESLYSKLSNGYSN